MSDAPALRPRKEIAGGLIRIAFLKVTLKVTHFMTLGFRVHMWSTALLTRIDKGRLSPKAFRGFLCLLFYMCTLYEMSHFIYFHLVEETWFNIDAVLAYLWRPSVKNAALRPMGHSYFSLFSEFGLFPLRIFYPVITQSSPCVSLSRAATDNSVRCLSVSQPANYSHTVVSTLSKTSFKFLSFLHCLISAVLILGFGGSQVIPASTEQKIISLYFSVLNIDC